MSEIIALKPTQTTAKKDKKQGIDLKSAYGAFITAYARKIEKMKREQDNVNQNV